MASRLTTIIVVSIVTATLIAGLIVGAQRDDYSGPVDVIIVNGKVYSADGSSAFHEAVALRGNQILKVGSNRDVRRLRRAQTVVIDAQGGAVLPGFNDARVNFLRGGLALDDVNVRDAATLEDVRENIRAYADRHPERPWVSGRGQCDPSVLGGSPSRQQLDAAVEDRPVFLTCSDGHTAWANSRALALAGITRRTPNPKNGIIVRDPRTGEPTGVLREAAQTLVTRVLPPPSQVDKLRALRAATDEAHRLGVTSVLDAGSNPEEFDLYDEVRKAGDLTVRVYAALPIEPGFTDADADRYDRIRAKYPDDPLFKAGIVAIEADGAVADHTAAMLTPYAGRSTQGAARFTERELDRVVASMDKRGWQIMTRAAGDRAVRLVLDAYEHAAAANPAPPRGRRHRIERVETIDPTDAPRFGELGVIPSQQPFQGNPSPSLINAWSASIGPERASRGWAAKSLSESGGRLVFGSEWPTVTLDPRFGLHMAVNRTTPDGTPEGGWLPDQKLPVTAAVDAYTRAGAYSSFDEQRKGAIKPGMLADLVILSRDIFTAAPEELLNALVDVTIFDGRVVYRRDAEKSTEQD